jgi:hypothetical protein
VDNGEAKELRMVAVLRGDEHLEVDKASQALMDSIDRLGHKFGASSVSITFENVPGAVFLADSQEADADWLVE